MPLVALFSLVAILASGVAVALTAPSGSGATTLSHAPHFFITSPNPGPVFSPAVPTALPLTYHNASAIALTITSVTVRLAAPIPAGCDASNLAVNGTSLLHPVTLGESLLVAAHSATSSPLTLEVIDKVGVDQSACHGAQLHFVYSGSAKYTDSTHTVLTLTPNPSKQGAPVTLTATVTSTYHHPHAPSGTVTFHRCTNSACTTAATVGSHSLNSSGVATTTTTVLPLGASRVYATYGGAGTNYLASTSARISHRVISATYHSPGHCIAASGATPTSVINTSHAGNVTVSRGQVLLLDGGRIRGDVTVHPGGKLLGRSGTVTGTVRSRGALVLDHVSVNGGVRVRGGGRVCLSHSRVSRSVLVSHTSHSVRPTRICGMTVMGSLELVDNRAASRAGGTPHCMGNVVSDRLVISGNKAPVRIGGLARGRGNIVGLGITVTANQGGGLLRHNVTGGSCQLSGNVPPIRGLGNAAGGTNTCNRTA